jgi:hypothetical protein
MATEMTVVDLYDHVRHCVRHARAYLAEAYAFGPGSRADRAEQMLLAVRAFNEATTWRDLARARRKQECA